MKKFVYKISFSIYNYFEPTTEEVTKIQMAIKGILGSIGAFSWLTSNPNMLAGTAVLALILDELAKCLYFEKMDVTNCDMKPIEDKNTENPQK